MKARLLAPGFGQIATKMKKSPSVANAGRAAVSTVSSTAPNKASALGQSPFKARRALACRADRPPIAGAEGDRARSADRASGLAHVIDGDRHVKGAFA